MIVITNENVNQELVILAEVLYQNHSWGLMHIIAKTKKDM